MNGQMDCHDCHGDADNLLSLSLVSYYTLDGARLTRSFTLIMVLVMISYLYVKDKRIHESMEYTLIRDKELTRSTQLESHKTNPKSKQQI